MQTKTPLFFQKCKQRVHPKAGHGPRATKAVSAAAAARTAHHLINLTGAISNKNWGIFQHGALSLDFDV